MSSTVDQLQQLSNSELFLMCNRYQFAARDIAYLTRRQLERRLHVAIVGERAMLRAHDLMQRIRSQKGHRDFNDWLGVNRIDSITQHLLPNSNRQKRMRNVSERRQTISLPNFQRFRGGVDPFMQIDELRQYSEESETLSTHDEMLESVGSEIDHLELTDEQKQQWRNEVRNQVRAREAMSTEHIDWNASVEAASDYYSLSENEESRSNLHFLSAQMSTDRISNNQIQRREERLRTISTNNIPLPSKKSDEEPISNNQLQRAEGLWTSTSTHNFHLSESDDEGDCTPEHLLSTFNYMDDLQSGDHIKEKSFEKLFNNGNSENIIVGDTLFSSPTNTNHRRTLWRCVFNMLCCNSQGKLDAGKLRYSILCCAMVICTYVGFKMLQ